ncbi:hypothetical protein [Levilactobacillus suantsaiihabitans]|uniref:Uncharacterized protein n=1 Tax=Levilactobacillus suantsaiihabitans TaxID=2487722 RepID=A0A4Z0J875_9LACO|nr:hypothetical protein [Levilactobacillus suantsaiihabitans]TGD18471.1 hypothetical protein EGT51_08310 [Levilactobacillus suantsaiihabitans]
MNKKMWLRIILLVMVFVLIAPVGADASRVKTVHATVNIGKNKAHKINTKVITKKWYRPRANKGRYARARLSSKGRKYYGSRVIAEKGHQFVFKRFAFLADGKTKRMEYYKIKGLKKSSQPQGVAIIGKNKQAKMYILMSNAKKKRAAKKTYGNARKG